MSKFESQKYSAGYDSKGRFCSYWHQIHEIIALKPASILEIGCGNGFVSKYLKAAGFNVITLDIDQKLNPDIVASVLQIPFPDESFEVSLCCETLEHLPYKNFGRALSEIFRVSKSSAVLSLPDISRVYRFNIQVPGFKEIKMLIPFFRLKKSIQPVEKEHCWEIGMAQYPLNMIIRDIEKNGFLISKTYRVFEMPYHRFFLLRKIKSGGY